MGDSHHATEHPVDVVITGPDGGEAVDLAAIRMRILEDGQRTEHRLGIGEITVPPHTDGPPQHRHARHDEGFYVVSGTARSPWATRRTRRLRALW